MVARTPPVLGLCQGTDQLPTNLSQWWMEPKLDGIRLQVTSSAAGVDFQTRGGISYNDPFPVIAEALTGVDAVIDTEAVWFDPVTGEVDFHKGSGMVRTLGPGAARRQEREGWITLMAFDFLSLGGNDLRRLPIERRRELLAQLVASIDCPLLRLVEQSEATPEAQAEYINRYREGVVLTRKGSSYPRGGTSTWLKLKVVADEDVVIMGAIRGEGKYANTLGAIEFGQYRDGVLTPRGSCSGMTDDVRDQLWHNLDQYIGKVLVIRHMGILQEGGAFRHPQWQRLRDPADKLSTDCTWT